MHPLEGVIILSAGVLGWLVATGRFPSDPEKRRELIRRAPWIQNQTLMYGMTALLWAFGLAVVFGLLR